MNMIRAEISLRKRFIRIQRVAYQVLRQRLRKCTATAIAVGLICSPRMTGKLLPMTE